MPFTASSTQEAIVQLFNEAIAKLQEGDERLTDLHILADAEQGEITIADDDGVRISTISIAPWQEDATTQAALVSMLRHQLTGTQAQGAFDQVRIARPYSFFLVDSDMETTEELIIIDDDIVTINDQLLPHLEDDLSELLKRLQLG